MVEEYKSYDVIHGGQLILQISKEKGKPVEKQGRKVTGLNGEKPYDSRTA